MYSEIPALAGIFFYPLAGFPVLFCGLFKFSL